MSKKAGALSAGLTIMALAGAAMVSLGTSPAQAVVYCKTVGVPRAAWCGRPRRLWSWRPERRSPRRQSQRPASARPGSACARERR